MSEIQPPTSCTPTEFQLFDRGSILDRVHLVESGCASPRVGDDIRPNSKELLDLGMIGVAAAPIVVHAKED
jgi:hypothetical protein